MEQHCLELIDLRNPVFTGRGAIARGAGIKLGQGGVLAQAADGVQQLGQMHHPELRDREQPGMDRQTADAPMHPLKSRAPIKAQTHGVSYQVVDPQRDAELTRQGIDMEAAGAQEPGVIQADETPQRQKQ